MGKGNLFAPLGAAHGGRGNGPGIMFHKLEDGIVRFLSSCLRYSIFNIFRGEGPVPLCGGLFRLHVAGNLLDGKDIPGRWRRALRDEGHTCVDRGRWFEIGEEWL